MLWVWSQQTPVCRSRTCTFTHSSAQDSNTGGGGHSISVEVGVCFHSHYLCILIIFLPSALPLSFPSTLFASTPSQHFCSHHLPCRRSGKWAGAQSHMIVETLRTSTITSKSESGRVETFHSTTLFPCNHRDFVKLYCLKLSPFSCMCVRACETYVIIIPHLHRPVPSSSTSRRRRGRQYYSPLECRIGLNLEPWFPFFLLLPSCYPLSLSS